MSEKTLRREIAKLDREIGRLSREIKNLEVKRTIVRGRRRNAVYKLNELRIARGEGRSRRTLPSICRPCRNLDQIQAKLYPRRGAPDAWRDEKIYVCGLERGWPRKRCSEGKYTCPVCGEERSTAHITSRGCCVSCAGVVG